MKIEKEMYIPLVASGIPQKIKKWYLRNKMIIFGIALCLVGIIACMVFPEDAMGGAFCMMLGIPVIFSGVSEKKIHWKQK